MPAESARSADKIKFLEQNICLHRSIKLHDAGRRFQLVVPWSVLGRIKFVSLDLPELVRSGARKLAPGR